VRMMLSFSRVSNHARSLPAPLSSPLQSRASHPVQVSHYRFLQHNRLACHSLANRRAERPGKHRHSVPPGEGML
jgi:hypothetical protein